jgi:hypothetical protein
MENVLESIFEKNVKIDVHSGKSATKVNIEDDYFKGCRLGKNLCVDVT